MALEYQIREAGLMEDALRTSELRYRRLFESATDGILIVDAHSREITDVNPALIELTGYTREELLGGDFRDLELFPDAQAPRVIIRELKDKYYLRHNDVYLRTKAGRYIHAEVVCNLHHEGVQTIIQCNIRDISERKRSDDLLLGQKRVLELLATGEGLHEVLETLIKVIEGQSEAVYGAVLVRQRNGRRFRMGVAPSLADDYIDALGQAPICQPYFNPCAMAADLGEPVGTADITSDRRWSSHWRDLATGHGLHTCYSSPIFASDGRILGSFGLYQCGLRGAEPPDPQLLETATHLAGIAIERRQIEKALRESDRRKDEFLAMLSHELRNPLAAIRNAIQLLHLGKGDHTVVTTASGILDRQVGQMVHLVDDLLEVSRISRGKVKLDKERVDLTAVVQQAIEAIGSALTVMGHELSVELPPGPVYLHGDACRLSQIVANLLDNACKYTAKGGHIRLSVEASESEAIIRVQDNGVGIAADELNHIFDMFAQVDASLERAHSGLGIGLTLVKSLVEMHGGTVAVHSEGRGRGSEFVVRLPIITEISQDTTAPRGATVASAQRILIVDDDVDAAASLAMLLKLSGHNIHTVHEAPRAVDATRTFEPDVILLDIGMPEMNGYEVARQIRQQIPNRKMALVALTGWGQDEDRRRSEEAGFDDHIIKPADYTALTQLIGRLSV